MQEQLYKRENSQSKGYLDQEDLENVQMVPNKTLKKVENDNNFNSKKVRQFNILLTQSERIINKARADQINKNEPKDSHKQYKQRIARDPQMKQLRLQKGSSFWSLKDDYQTIYNNFNLLSYFSSSWGIQVLSRKRKTNRNQIQIEQQFLLKRQQHCKMTIIETYRDKFNQSGILRIQYEVIDYEKKIRRIQVLIQPQIRSLTDPQQYIQHTRNQKRVAERFRQFIKIKVADIDGWIIQKRNYTYSKQRHHRVSELRKAKVWETEYFYIEPSEERHKIIQGEHISLALQGGGCKGVQYIGAYRAILQSRQNVNIKSVIGSSAGGIIGLAICCKLSPDQVQNICVSLLSKVTNDKKFRNNDAQFMQKTFNQIVKTMKTINIFQEKIIDMITKWLKDEEFQAIFLKFLYANTNPQVYKLFISDQRINGQDQLNMTGLFSAQLMTGSIIRHIATTFYLQSNSSPQIKQQINFLKQKYAKFSDQQKESKLKYSYIGQNLTMKELYNFTGIQFTCTAVDIDNHVLRFFNQKTTPDLPVCYAVQMTGSFPVAFEAQTWKKQWGKYYVHYENIRKQIDITGCRITDGGTLANFPVKYLDNEEMRPMYFSHAKTKDTIIYGLGLKTYITQTQAQKQAKKLASENLANYISQNISSVDIMKSWIKQKVTCCFKPKKKKIDLSKNSFQGFGNIPLIEFALSLLLTYSTSKDNLTQQCFIHSSYETIAGQSYINQVNLRPSQQKLGKQILKLVKIIQENLIIRDDDIQSCFIDNLRNFKQATLANYLSQNYLCDIQKNLFDNSTILLHCIQSYLNPQQKNVLFQKMGLLLLSSFNERIFNNDCDIGMDMDMKNLIKQEDQTCRIQDAFEVIRNMTKQKQFVLCSIEQDLQTLESMANTFQKLTYQMKQIQFKSKFGSQSILTKVLKQIRDQQQQQLKKIKQELKNYADKKMKFNKVGYMQTIQEVEYVQESDLYESNRLLNQRNKKYNNKRLSKSDIEHLKNAYFVDRKVILLLSKLPSLSMTLSLKGIQRIIKQIKHSAVPQFFINYEAQDNKNLIKSYTLNRIVQETTKIRKLQNPKEKNQQFTGIHIVLESVPLSQMYFHEYFRIVRETIIQYNQGVKKKTRQRKQKRQNYGDIKSTNDKNLPLQSEELKQIKVTTMTATGSHSLIMFLYASDLSQERISQQVWKIRDLIRLNQQQIKSKYQNKDWAKITPILLREFQSQAEKNKKDIFEEIKQANKNMNSSQPIQNVTKNIRKQVDQVRFSNQQMNGAIQNSLNYIVGKIMKFQGKNDADTNAAKTQKLMSELVIDMPNNKFQTENAKVAAQLKKLSSFFLDKFEDILKYMFYWSPRLVDQVVNSLRPAERQQAWRGILLSQILSGRQIKDYVKSILRELNFKPETTLKEFYEYSEKKIQLNFSVVEEDSVAIYNHISRPNIPLWAAILAASSIPQFYSPLVTRPEWTSKFEINHNKRQVQKYFRQSPNPYRLLTSSEALTRFPLDLLRNNKLKTMLSERENQIFLIFNFSQYELPSILKNMIHQLKVAPLTLGEIVTKFVSLKKQVFGCNDPKSEQAMNAKALGMLANLPTITQKLGSLSLYIQSHDNLILKLYKAELVQFPIRFDTLDFHKITTMQNGKQRLSDICSDAIMQAQFILSEKISNNYSGQKKVVKSSSFQTQLVTLKSLNSTKVPSLLSVDSVQEGGKNIKDQKDSMIKYKTKKQGKDKSKRQIYFRVQSASKDQIKQYQEKINPKIKEQNQNRKLYKKNNQLSQSRTVIKKQSGDLFSSYATNQNIAERKFVLNQQSQFRILKIRFLSILNPSRKTYQKFYIYYKQKENEQYKRIQAEEIFVSQKNSQKIYLKIQFPNSQVTAKKTRWLILDLKQLYQLTKNQELTFGFVYKLNFDGLYSKLSKQQLKQIQRQGKLKIFNEVGGKPVNSNRLQPQNFYKQDYMNRKNNLNPPSIYIKSDVRNINYKAILCEDCVTEVQKVPKDANNFTIKNKSLYQYRCLNKNCLKQSQITDKYKVQFDYQKEIYKCAMNHKLQILQDLLIDTSSIENGMNTRRCDLCGKVNISKLWKDKNCNIIICDDCKNHKLEENN